MISLSEAYKYLVKAGDYSVRGAKKIVLDKEIGPASEAEVHLKPPVLANVGIKIFKIVNII